MFGRRKPDPEAERLRMDLSGRFDDVEVLLHDVDVSRRQSGDLKLADPDATVDWLRTAEVQLDMRRSPRRGSACTGCGSELPDEPAPWSPRPLEVPGDHTGPIEVTAPARVCGDCGAVHVHRVEQFYSDYLDAIIVAMDSAGGVAVISNKHAVPSNIRHNRTIFCGAMLAAAIVDSSTATFHW